MNDLAMDAPYRPAAFDRAQQGLLGKPIDRYEAREKVSGAAPYAFEQAPENTAYLAIVQSSIGRGRVTGVDAAAAEAAPGVIAVIHGDPRMPTGEGNSRAMSAIGKDEVFHYGQGVAIVVAETQEAARAAARLVTVSYEETAGRFDAAEVEIQQDHKLGFLPPVNRGDLDAALAAAEVVIDRTYTTPIHFPAALEPHATTAWWEGDRLIVRSSNQVIGGAKGTIATALGIDRDRVRVLAPYVGGGFGGKTGVGPK